jgi:hypothetical protein
MNSDGWIQNMATRIENVSVMLEQFSYPDDGDDNGVPHSVEQVVERYHVLRMEWDCLLEQVRSLSGFEDFLKLPGM